MPDDAALTSLDVYLGRSYAEVLIVTADLLDAPVEDDEVVHDLKEPLLAAELSQLQEQGIVAGGRVSVVLLPAQPILLRRLDHAVTQPLGFVSRHHELHGRKERPGELGLLAVEVLANALGDRHRGALQLQHAESDAVDVEHEVRTLGVPAGDRHLFGNGEIVVAGILPVDQPDGDGLLAPG